MPRHGVLLILGTALALLPGCLRQITGSRSGPEFKAPSDPIAVSGQPAADKSVTRKSELSAVANPMADIENEPLPPSAPDAASIAKIFWPTTLQKPTEVGKTLPERDGAAVPAPIPQPLLAAKTPPLDEHPVQGGVQLAQPASEPPVLSALKCILNDHPETALEHLKGFDSTTQDFLIRLLPALGRLSQTSLDKLSPQEAALLQDQLNSLLEALRPFTKLTISRMCFCEWIKGYGNYKPLSEDHVFRAASKKDWHDGEQVQLYVELKNFRCEPHDGYHEIRLSSTVEIRDLKSSADDEALWFFRFPDQNQPIRSRALVHDFFNPYTFSVPHIPPGAYLLKIEIRDETSPDRPRVAWKMQEFRVGAMPPGQFN